MTTSPPYVEDASTAPVPAATGARPTRQGQLTGDEPAALAEVAAPVRALAPRAD